MDYCSTYVESTSTKIGSELGIPSEQDQILREMLPVYRKHQVAKRSLYLFLRLAKQLHQVSSQIIFFTVSIQFFFIMHLQFF